MHFVQQPNQKFLSVVLLRSLVLRAVLSDERFESVENSENERCTQQAATPQLFEFEGTRAASRVPSDRGGCPGCRTETNTDMGYLLCTDFRIHCTAP